MEIVAGEAFSVLKCLWVLVVFRLVAVTRREEIFAGHVFEFLVVIVGYIFSLASLDLA